MTVSSWIKATASSMTAMLRSETQTVRYSSLSDAQILHDTVQQYNTPLVHERLKQMPLTSEAVPMHNDYNIDAALWFHCDPKIAAKIDKQRSADGHKLVQANGSTFTVWNVDTQRHETWQNIYSGIDEQTKTQICATYNVDTQQFAIHLGGTDFNNQKDLKLAKAAIQGKTTPRVAAGAVLTETAIQYLLERNPGLDLEKIDTRISAHSRGGEAAPMSMLALLKHGFKLNEVMICDPFGAATAFETVEHDMDITDHALQNRVTSVKAKKKGILDIFKNASRLVGHVQMCDAGGHFGKHYITYFDDMRVVAYNAKKTRKHAADTNAVIRAGATRNHE